MTDFELRVYDVLGPYDGVDPNDLRPVPGGDDWRGSLHDFLAANEEWLEQDPETRTRIKSLRSGQHLLIGGGAAPWVAVVRERRTAARNRANGRHPARFEVWEMRGRSRPALEGAYATFDEARRAAEEYKSEFGGRYFVADRWLQIERPAVGYADQALQIVVWRSDENLDYPNVP